MNRLSLSGIRSLIRTSLKMAFFLVMTSYAAWSLTLAAQTEPIVSLPGGVGPRAAELKGGATPANPDMVLPMRIYLDIRNRQSAQKMDEDLHDASTPIYHKWINPQIFDAMFGPLQASYDDIEAWLKSQGFTVSAVRHDRRDVEFTGTVSQADQVFTRFDQQLEAAGNLGDLHGAEHDHDRSDRGRRRICVSGALKTQRLVKQTAV